MIGFKHAGINRVSLGVQSFDDGSLLTIGRLHSKNRSIEAIEDIQKAGITNISIDIMYDRPNQTLSMWKTELDYLKRVNVQHVSLYNMTIEEGSAYKRIESKIKSLQPSDHESLELHMAALEALEASGFKRYEISAFSKPGFESRHNLGYWRERSFYGLGPSAFSYINHSRKQHVACFHTYVDHIMKGKLEYGFEETLDEEARKRELFAVEARVLSGVDSELFENTHGPISHQMKRDLQLLIDKDLILLDQKRYKLTEKGRLFYDEVGAILV